MVSSYSSYNYLFFPSKEKNKKKNTTTSLKTISYSKREGTRTKKLQEKKEIFRVELECMDMTMLCLVINQID